MAKRIAPHNHKIYCPSVEFGEYVYLRHRPAGRNKIQDAWSPVVYQLIDIVGTTCTVQPVEGGPIKRVNRADIRSCVNPPDLTQVRMEKALTRQMETTEPNTDSCDAYEGDIIIEEVSFNLTPCLDLENCSVGERAQKKTDSQLMSEGEPSVIDQVENEHDDSETCTTDQPCEVR